MRSYKAPQVSYGKGPEYFRLKTAISRFSISFTFQHKNSVLGWKIISMTILNKADSYLHAQNKQFLY